MLETVGLWRWVPGLAHQVSPHPQPEGVRGPAGGPPTGVRPPALGELQQPQVSPSLAPHPRQYLGNHSQDGLVMFFLLDTELNALLKPLKPCHLA